MLGNYLVVASDSPQATIHNFKEYMLDEFFGLKDNYYVFGHMSY